MKRIALMMLLVTTVFAAAPNGLRAKEFIVMGYEGLLQDLAKGKGHYLDTLQDLLAVEPKDQKAFADQVQLLSKSAPNIMDFADQVVALKVSIVAAPTASIPTVVPSTVVSVPVPQGPHIYSGDKLQPALEHLTRGMEATVYLKNGEKFTGQFMDYEYSRITLRKAPQSRSFRTSDILAVESSSL